MQKTDSIFLTLRETANVLRLSRNHVARLVRSGRLPIVHFGLGSKRRCVRIPRAALDKLAE